jgi:glycosyltransferase involved in cell wall biosynthesis
LESPETILSRLYNFTVKPDFWMCELRSTFYSPKGTSVFNSANHDHKINLLIAVAGLNIGGAEVVIRDLTRMIDTRRFNVTVFCLKTLGIIGRELVRDGYDIIATSDSDELKVDYFSFLQMLRVIHKKRIDIVHTHTTDALADAAVCKMLRPWIKLIHTFHFGNYPHQDKNIMWMEFLSSKFVNRLVAVGEVQLSQLMAVYKFRCRRITRIWNGVTIAKRSGGEAFRTQIGVDNASGILIGTIATLTTQKGLSDFLTVASRFRNAKHKVGFVIVGDGPLRKDLEAMQRDLGLEDIVLFTGWVRNASEIALPALDVFFQPSLWEAMSIAILEAMAAAKPIVATRVGETPHIIEDGTDGLLVDPHDIEGMAAALWRLVNDTALRRRMGAAAARKFSRYFTVRHMTRAYENLYLNLID